MKFTTLITLTVASTLAVLSRSVDASTLPCSGKCPSVIAPVCAQNAAGLTHTFVNSCELSQSNCQDPNDIYAKISDKACPGDDGMVKRGIFDGPAPVPGCPKTCPSVIQRICGQNNAGTQVTFINSCRLSVTQCQYPTLGWNKISDGYCPNDSNLQKRGIIDGPLPVPGCPKTCPSVIQRICGQNKAGTQATFINSCSLSVAQCQYPTEGWNKISDGYCPNDSNLQKRSIWDQPIPEPGCSQECPSVISPVCAQNQLGQQKTFVNSCRMAVANCEYPAEQWSIVERKTCAGDLAKRSILTDDPILPKKCSQQCPDVLQPTCGQDKDGKQVTFANSCQLKVAQCEYPNEGWTKFSDKTCSGDLN